MRYCYCEKCQRVFPRNWYGRDQCEICRSTCEIVHVPRTIYGKASLFISGVAAILLLFYILNDPFGVRALSFMGDIEGVWFNISVILLLAGAFITGYMDLGHTKKLAESMVRGRKI